MTAQAVDPARAGALFVLFEWDRRKRVFVEKLVHDYLEAHVLSPRDRRFLVELCYGGVRHRNTLRHLSEHLLRGDLGHYAHSVRTALALGLYQRVYLRTPPHAVVTSTIEAWKSLDPRRQQVERSKQKKVVGLINAVLRRACDRIEHLDLEALDRDDPDAVRVPHGWARIEGLGLPRREVNLPLLLGIKYSHPPDLVRIWLRRYEEPRLLEILERNNEVPPTFLVIRRDRGDAASFLQGLGETGRTGRVVEEDPQLLRLDGSGPVGQLPGYETGDFWVQDVTARRLAMLLPQREHAALMDLCASPGGKLATLLDRGGIGSVLACDVRESKLRILAENLHRLRFETSRVRLLEIPDDPARIRLEEDFDQVLVDAPCSNTGVLGRRHEARWRFLPEKLRELQRTQQALLRAGARYLRSGGDLLYTTCSLEPQENSDVVHGILRAEPRLRLLQEEEILPGERDGDGGYAALLRKVN